MSNYNLNCTNFTEDDFNTFNISRGASGGVCTLVAVGVLLLLVCNKIYRSPLQRMFLYLTTTTILLEAFLTLQIERQFHYPGQEQFCSALGFLVQISGGVSYIFTLGITVLSMYTVYKKLRGHDLFQKVAKSKQLRITMETLFVLGAIIIPLTYQWVPFIQGNYGLAGPFCWIRSIDENCIVVGGQVQLAFYITAEVLSMISLIAAVVLAIVYCRIACKYKAVRNQQTKLVRQTLLLMCFLSTHVFTLTAGLLARYITDVTGHESNYGLWILNSAGIPVSLLVIPLGFLVYLNTINSEILCGRCKRLQRQINCINTCCVKGNQNVEDGTEWLNTHPSSHPVYVPSYTHWSVPYTGQFTSVGEPVVMEDMGH